MESDLRYYARRAIAETLAARRAVTPEARERRLHLADLFNQRVAELRG